MIQFIVATHGPLAAALLESGEMVYGELPNLRAVCLTGERGIEGFRHDFTTALAQASEGASGILVLCDMQSGTPWNVACEAAFNPLTQPPIAVVAGVSFPMLLQTDEVTELDDVQHAAAQLLELTFPTLIQARHVVTEQTDDF